MKNNLFNSLVKSAQKEAAPQVYVADRVISTLVNEGKKLELYESKFMMFIAALSSAVAVPAALLAVFLHNFWIGPLFEISRAISWVL
jgi:hypothetical protein